MRVSIAMCTYNGERYLSEQLESIIQQSYMPDELIVCDDDSRDNTLDMLKKYKQRAPFDVRIYRNKSNLGFVKNFEKAISLCTGDIIFLSDQDDIWMRGRIERSVEVLSSSPQCGYIFSDANLIDAEGQLLNDTLWSRINFTLNLRKTFQDPESQPVVLYPKNYVTGATMAFKAQYREKIFPIPALNTISHDGWIAIILSLFGHYGVATKDPLICYRIHPKQQIGAKKKSLLHGLPKRFTDHRAKVVQDIFDVSVIKSQIELSCNRIAIKRFDGTVGRSLLYLEKRSHLLKESLRLHRVIPVLKLYKTGGYQNYSSPHLSALKDIFY